MVRVQCFEDLNIWQEARRIVKEVYLITSHIKDFGFNDQIQRAAVSVMNNIAEGFETDGDNMFKKYLSVAKGSCGEVRSMLYIAIDLNYMDAKQAEKLILDCKGLSAGINKLIFYLK